MFWSRNPPDSQELTSFLKQAEELNQEAWPQYGKGGVGIVGHDIFVFTKDNHNEIEWHFGASRRAVFFDRIEAWIRAESYQRHSIEHLIHAEGTVPTDHVRIQKNLIGDNHQLFRVALPPENYFTHLLRTLWKR